MGLSVPVFVVFGKHTLYGVKVRITDLNKERKGIRPVSPFFSARNGMWNQKLRLRKVDNGWSTAVQVWSCDRSKPQGIPIFEKVDDNFPKNEKGLVDWGL